MKVSFNEIPKDGLYLEEIVPAAALELESADISFVKPLRIKAKLERGHNSVRIHLAFESRIRCSCGRCLSEDERDLSKEADIVKAAGEEDAIDIIEAVREEIIIDYPLKILCRPDCKGLCPVCGANLNEETCGCESNKEERGE